MSFGIVAGAAVGLVGASMSASAAKKGVKAQQQAAEASDATQRYMYDTTREDNAPFRQAGVAANNNLAEMMNRGDFWRKFNYNDIAADPVYQSSVQFGLDEGRKGINRQSAAGGSYLSGATLKALTRFGNDYGSTKLNESYNRFHNDQNATYNKLAGLSGAGQQATQQIGAAGQNMANNISATQQGMGNARASGYIAQSNAWQNGMNGAVSAFRNQPQQNSLSGVWDDGYGSGQGSAYAGSVNDGMFTPNRRGM